MLRPLAILLTLSVVAALAACGGGRAGAGSGTSPNVIGNWELEAVPDYNALEAVRQLRPGWLRIRSEPSDLAAQAGASPYPRVHMDGVPLGDISELEQIRTDNVREMRFLSGGEASMRWGTGYTNGVILVTTEH